MPKGVREDLVNFFINLLNRVLVERQLHLTEEKINLCTGVQHTKEEDQSGLAGNQSAENMDLEEAEEAE